MRFCAQSASQLADPRADLEPADHAVELAGEVADVAAQIVADALGLDPKDIRVIADFDSARDAWSIATWVAAHFTARTVGGVTVYDLTSPKP